MLNIVELTNKAPAPFICEPDSFAPKAPHLLFCLQFAFAPSLWCLAFALCPIGIQLSLGCLTLCLLHQNIQGTKFCEGLQGRKVAGSLKILRTKTDTTFWVWAELCTLGADLDFPAKPVATWQLAGNFVFAWSDTAWEAHLNRQRGWWCVCGGHGNVSGKAVPGDPMCLRFVPNATWGIVNWISSLELWIGTFWCPKCVIF